MHPYSHHMQRVKFILPGIWAFLLPFSLFRLLYNFLFFIMNSCSFMACSRLFLSYILRHGLYEESYAQMILICTSEVASIDGY
jgi:hypothetical protein